MKKIEAVDLFCGAGGLTAGLIEAGIEVKAGYDIEEPCRFPYIVNNNIKFINKDIQTLTGEELLRNYSSNTIKLLAGCAPCQPFSTYNQGKNTVNDKKWPLLYSFLRLINEINPELVTMENVPDVTKHQVYADFIENLKDKGYRIWEGVVSCVDYGIPQIRRRYVTLASKISSIQILPPTHQQNPILLKDIIKDLPPIKAGTCSENDFLHFSSKLSDLNLERIRNSKPGGSWKEWPKHLQLNCHKKKSGASYGGIYGRMEWDKPAPTITTQCFGYGNGRFGHPEQNRAISLREAALIQTFPMNYIFSQSKNFSIKTIGKMIGNAVPVRLGWVIGKSFINHIS